MSGGAGDDLLVATSGDDTVDGGDGSDTVVVHDNGGAALGGLRDFDLSGVSASGGALSGTLGTPDGRTVTLAGVEVVKVAETGSSTFLVLDGMSIQAAIDAAEAGDTILVQNGTYTEDLTLKDGISVIGESEAGVVLNGTVSTPTTLQDAVLSGMTVQNVGDTMLLDMRGTTAVTDVVFEQVTFSLTSDFTGPIAIGNGQGGSTMAIADGDGDDAGLVFRNVTMASNDHDFASATAFAYTLVESVDGARMVLDGVVLSGTATGTGSGLGAQWNMSPQDNGKSAAVEIVNSQTSRGGNFYVSGFDSVLIQDNVFDGQGIALNGVENAVVTGNTFQNIDDTFTANGTQHRGLTIEDAWGTDGVSNLVVTGNTFTNITAVDGAIAFRTFNGGTPPDVATVERLNQVQITGNTFTGLGVGVEAIFILDQYFGPGAVLPAQFGLENLIIGTSDDDVITAPTDGGTGIFADAGNDSLTGGGGNDQLSGGGGNDTLDGGAGGDEMAGGDGDDTYVVDDDGDIVVEAAGEGHDVVRTTLNRYDLPDHVEDLVFEGNGRLIAHGNAEDNTIGGTKRHDRLFGGDGNDTLTGGPGEDSLYGQGGDDLLVGGGGSDILRGGAGDDVLRGGGSADMLIGNGGRDTLIGAGGNDTLNGGGGADVMIGGAGNDTYVVNAAGDVVEETANGGNHDEVQSGNLSLDLADYANIEDATLTGTGNLDLTGNDDRNRLTGNDGDNTIFGGLGGDILTGGGGADVFVYTAVEQSTQGADRDRIADFEQGFDLIDLFAIDAKDAAPGNNAFVWLGTDAFSGAEGELRYSVNNAGHARVQADTNGDGVADFEIVVLNAPLLNDGDFML